MNTCAAGDQPAAREQHRDDARQQDSRRHVVVDRQHVRTETRVVGLGTLARGRRSERRGAGLGVRPISHCEISSFVRHGAGYGEYRLLQDAFQAEWLHRACGSRLTSRNP